MKKILLMLVLCAFSFPAAARFLGAEPPARDAFRFSLEDCIEYAMGNSYVRKQMQLTEESTELTLSQSKLERLPSLSGSIGENFSHSQGNGSTWSGTYGVSTGITVFQGGNINKTIEQNRLKAGQSEVKTAQYDNTLTMNILSSYFLILGYDELLKYQKSLISESEEQVEQGRSRLRAGTILESDYLMLESQLAANNNSIVETGINLENEFLTLKGLLSMDAEAYLEIIAPDTSAVMTMAVVPVQQEYLDHAAAILPDLELLDYGVRIAESNLKLARSSYWPTLSLSGGISTGHAVNVDDYGNQLSDRFSQSAGLSLSIPIFNRNRTRTNVEQSKIALKQAELDRKQSEFEIRQSLIKAYRDVESSLSKYETYGIRERAYRETFRVYNRQFDAGSITAVELLQQQNNYISVMYDYVQSKYGFMLRRKILDVYMGLEITM